MTITAEIIADSINDKGQRITTFELVYPRIIHAELLVHRVFSRNSASSRAIPIEKMNDLIMEDVAKPWRFGKANKGMQDAGEHDEPIMIADLYVSGVNLGLDSATANKYATRPPSEAWEYYANQAVEASMSFHRAGYAKQVCNRLTEFAQHMKVIVTATSYDNWFWLRDHTDADPTIEMLAKVMWAAFEESDPRVLLPGEWHVPYYFDGYWSDNGDGLDVHNHILDDALKISSSCCAQVSFRSSDDSLAKAKAIFSKLIESTPCHASPVEHQATPMEVANWRIDEMAWEDGVTHMDRDGGLWSGNFKGWIQHRQLIPNHVCTEYQKET